MRIDILTLFPEMCDTVLRESIIGRARERGLVELNCRNIRDYTLDKHNRVDDTPYGGGMGMVMQTQPIYDCFQALWGEVGRKPHFIYLSPQGKVLTQNRVRELAEYENLALLCGHYEGVDERVIEELVDEEISIGDYVLTGGELPALVLVDAVCRMLPGVLANDEAFQEESHFHSFWNTRNIPDPMNGTEKRCPMCYSPATMPTSCAGAGSVRSSAPFTGGPTYWKRRSSIKMTVLFWPA